MRAVLTKIKSLFGDDIHIWKNNSEDDRECRVCDRHEVRHRCQWREAWWEVTRTGIPAKPCSEKDTL